MRGRFGKWKTKCENKKLCKRFPFLIPWNRFSGQYLKNYDYSFTELDMMPEGWRKAFGLQMCEEIREELIRVNDLDRWRIVQMKEKYGMLCVYDNGYKQSSSIRWILDKYESLSARTCIKCGAPATRVTGGWLAPYCDKCCPDINAFPIDEYLKEGEDLEQ